MHIQEMRKILHRFFHEQLAADELLRATRGPQPLTPPNEHGEYDDFDFILDGLSQELGQSDDQFTGYLDDLLEKEGITMDPESTDYNVFYRELLKVHIELIKIYMERCGGRYSDEVSYLHGDPESIGADSRYVFSFDDSSEENQEKVKNILSNYQRFGRLSGVERTRQSDEAHKEFDQCVKGILKNHPNLPDSSIASKCAEITGSTYGDRTLRGRVKRMREEAL